MSKANLPLVYYSKFFLMTIATYEFECKKNKRVGFRFNEEIHYATNRVWDQCTTSSKGIWKRPSFHINMYVLRIFQSKGEEEEEKSTAAQPTYVHHHLKIRQFYISRCLDYGVSQSLRVYSYITKCGICQCIEYIRHTKFGRVRERGRVCAQEYENVRRRWNSNSERARIGSNQFVCVCVWQQCANDALFKRDEGSKTRCISRRM